MNKYTSIILASRDTNEYDRVYFLYTLEQGLVRAIGRGVRKPAAKLAGHLEPATMSEIYIARSRGMGQITGAITIRDFKNIKIDLEKVGEFMRIFRFFIRNFSEGEQDRKLFKLLEELMALSNLENRDEKGEKNFIFEGFWWKLFDLLGQKPEVSRCVNCSNMLAPNSLKVFSIRRGGVFCSLCKGEAKDAMPVSDNQIKLLRIFFSNSLKVISKIKSGQNENQGLARLRVIYTKYHFG